MKLSDVLWAKRMSQRDLVKKSKEMCVTPLPSYLISNLCRGKVTNLQVTTLIKICRILDVTPNDILSAKDYMDLFKENE